jgi:hypothetical protein
MIIFYAFARCEKIELYQILSTKTWVIIQNYAPLWQCGVLCRVCFECIQVERIFAKLAQPLRMGMMRIS